MQEHPGLPRGSPHKGLENTILIIIWGQHMERCDWSGSMIYKIEEEGSWTLPYGRILSPADESTDGIYIDILR